MPQIDPGEIAHLDQADAFLDEVVRVIRDHRSSTGCRDRYCIGRRAFNLIDGADTSISLTALANAAARLAKP